MYVAEMLALAALISLGAASSNATFTTSAPSDVVARCRISKKITASCWKSLSMDSYMQHWNRTTTTCGENELWANCFMREAIGKEVEGFGCAQVGPNTCPEPEQAFGVTQGSAETFYGAYSIWCKSCPKVNDEGQGKRQQLTFSIALQQYMTNLYDSVGTNNGSAIVRDTCRSMKPPITGSLILREMLLRHAKDARNRSLALVLSQSMPGKGLKISDESFAPKIVEQVLSVVLEHIMTNFTDGAYSLLATGGKLI